MINEDTAPVVRRIFEMRAAGTGFHAIAVMLNEEGHPVPPVCCTTSARDRPIRAGSTTNGQTRR